eukprot:CAMPEP_0177597316 /NCGR_PEP_ID=MMETSP0419_2-20121207/11637_1 /TAXON_ID=582737 /ORGANISM="Tetraselmis sp., Strain GSL018" /LENGTH=864 /DNA_ID=CAMNT_0019089459 /DNA_START=236 /DNA_END=2828 /DNA_ORIENTATION=-
MAFSQKAEKWKQFQSELESLTPDKQNGNTDLHLAVISSEIRVAEDLIDAGTCVDVANHLNQTPLHLAAWIGADEFVKLLLELGAETALKTKTGKLPLHMAAWKGHPSTAKLLVLRDRTTLEAQDATGETPLHWASWRGKVRTIDQLIDLGANVEAEDQFGMTPLVLAAQGGKHRAIGRLLDRGADIYASDEEGETALHWAAEKGNLKAVVELLGRGAHVQAVDLRERTPLHLACHGGHVEIARELLRRCADLGKPDQDGSLPLHLAALEGHGEVAQELLAQGADLRSTDKDGMTPLHLASWVGNDRTVQDLLSWGADVDPRCKAEGAAPIHLAASEGHVAVVKTLLSRQANPDSTDKAGRTPLHIAAGRGHRRVVELLLQTGASVSPEDQDSNTPLDASLAGQHAEVADLLSSCGAQPRRVGLASSAPPHPLPFSGLAPGNATDARSRLQGLRQSSSAPKAVSTQIREDQERKGLQPAVKSPDAGPVQSPLPYRSHTMSPQTWNDLRAQREGGTRASSHRWTPSPLRQPARRAAEQCPACETEPPQGFVGVASDSPRRRFHPGTPSSFWMQAPMTGRSMPSTCLSTENEGTGTWSGSVSPPARRPTTGANGVPGPVRQSWASSMAHALEAAIPNFSAEELSKATDDFAESNVLGESDDAVVYLGTIDGEDVAVRILNPYLPHASARFEQQLMVAAASPHPNVLGVRGLCTEEYSIVCEYAHHGRLDYVIAQDKPSLTWKDRILIAYGIGAGLNHLHNCCPTTILHANLSLSNVLLDRDFNPKLAGLSRACLESEAHHNHKSLGEQDGAEDPPAAEQDIAAFGVILLQILTGDTSGDSSNLVSTVEKAFDDNRLLRIVDRRAGNW